MNPSLLYVIAFVLAIAAGALSLLGDSTSYRIGAAVLGVLAVLMGLAGRRSQR